MTPERFSIETSSMLGWMTLLTVLMAVVQIIRDRRDWEILTIFLVFVAGISEREFVVMYAGPGYWPPIIFMLSAAAKWQIIFAATVFIWKYTKNGCGPWLAFGFLFTSGLLTLGIR